MQRWKLLKIMSQKKYNTIIESVEARALQANRSSAAERQPICENAGMRRTDRFGARPA